MKIYSNEVLRTVALQCVGLNEAPNKGKPSIEKIDSMVSTIGAVQIDTLQVVHRSHYLTLWSRLGNYDFTLFDRLVGDPSFRTLFEGWFHCACYIPLSEFRYEMVRQRTARENGHHWYNDWNKVETNRQKMADVLQYIRDHGEITTASLDGEKTKFATWWDWRPEKMALEHLWTYGDLMITRREKFRKVYALTENVLPANVDRTEPTEEERDLHWIEEGVRRLGVVPPKMAGDYNHLQRGKVHPLTRKLLKEGKLVEISGETTKGVVTFLTHPNVLELFDKAADGELNAQRTTFINPFDNLWWAIGRDEILFGFKQRLEAYVPAPKRIYGYYCLPILHRGRLIGRFDPKLDRKNGLLNILGFYLEPGVDLSDQDLAELTSAFKDFLDFHHAAEMVIHYSNEEKVTHEILRRMQ